ncbi:hypothetical protein ABBQ32_000088 [Trebouxia sp. C0010 RCD-2024]
MFAKQITVSTTSLNYDFALLTLQDPVPYGTARLALESGVGSQSYDLTTAGYSGDKDFGTMWTTNCSDVNINFAEADVEACGDDCDNMVQHSCLAYKGQAGSSLWSGKNTRYIRAIITGARTLSDGTHQNVGIKLNAFVYNTICSWYNEDETIELESAGHQSRAPAPDSAVHGTTNSQDGEDETNELRGPPNLSLGPASAPGPALAPAPASAPASASAPAPALASAPASAPAPVP